MADDGSLQRAWACPNGLAATLTHYPGAARHAPHAHDHLQISFLLAGGMHETLEGRDYAACGVWRGHKPAGAVHSDAWGASGVLVFTLRLDEAYARRVGAFDEPGWAPVAEPRLVKRLVRLFAAEAMPQWRAQAAADLFARQSEDERPRAAAPSWLKRAREAIEDDPDGTSIEEAAGAAGIHRVHLSRMFRRFYGVPPSLYRRNLLVARAASALVRSGTPLAQVAADAGFCDQSHLSRAMRSAVALTPGELRALLMPLHASNPPGGGSC